jgi:ketosteroid isomerase-like protein
MSEENVEVVKAAFARASRGDFDGLLALFHPGVEWVEDPHVPGAIARRGHAEVKRYFERMPRHGAELRVEPERFVDYDDEVLALVRVTTHARRGGPEIDRPFDAIFTVRDRKIVRGRWFSSRHDALDAAGLRE